MMTKRFKLRDIGQLLDGTDYELVREKPFDEKTSLVRAELIDDGDADIIGESGFRLVFMDPRDDLFYVARFSYEKEEGGPVFWYGLREGSGDEILRITRFWDLDEVAQLECTVDCTRVEHRKVTRTEWVMMD